jgi:hypothetical protein
MGVEWSARQNSHGRKSQFSIPDTLRFSSSSSFILTRLSGPCSRLTATQKIWQGQESNQVPMALQPGIVTTRQQRRSLSLSLSLYIYIYIYIYSAEVNKWRFEVLYGSVYCPDKKAWRTALMTSWQLAKHGDNFLLGSSASVRSPVSCELPNLSLREETESRGNR